jgi:hypothetical protein
MNQIIKIIKAMYRVQVDFEFLLNDAILPNDSKEIKIRRSLK